MVKLNSNYREAVKRILKRNWMNNRDKYYCIDSIVMVLLNDSNAGMKDLNILQKIRNQLLV